MLAGVGGLANESAAAITASLLGNVRAFANSAPQSDDLAILVVQVNGGSRLTLTLPATPEDVMRGVEALQAFATAQHVPEKAIFGLALALEECASNIVNHALKRDAGKTFQVAFERTRDSFIVELRDDGPEFDPTGISPSPSKTADDDEPGGWGIALARRNTDEIHYRRDVSRNTLRLTKRLVPASGDE